MSNSTPCPGWFMCYVYVFSYDGCRVNFGSTCWADDGETPWDKINRWNKEHEERHYVLVSFQWVDEVFEIDSET